MTKKFKKGQIISKEGTFELWMYELRAGHVALYEDYGTEDERLITVINAPGFFGEMGMLEAMPRFGTTVALDKVEVEIINMDNLSEYLSDKPAKIVQILENVCEKLRGSSKYFLKLCDLIAEYVECVDSGKDPSQELRSRLLRAINYSKKHHKIKG